MNFLFFEMKTVCYNSYFYFADSLAGQLKALGHNVEIFRITEESFDALESYVGKSYDAIVDFNSDLPRALLDDDSYFLDHINGPFFDIILDHPLYHHDSLKNKLTNFHVICLDEDHKNYINKYYPHIKSCTVCPMTGELAFAHDKINWDEFENRPYDLLFSGTYTDPVRIERAIHNIPDFLAENVHSIIDIMLADSSKTIEEAVLEIAENDFDNYINSDIPLHTQSFYLADAYVRAYNRKMLVKELDLCQHNLQLFGGLWDELDLKNATIHREVPFNFSFTLFSKSKISVNIMPNFKKGSHDRVFSAQLNGAVSLTDSTSLLKNEYIDNKNILFFDTNNLEGLHERLDYLLEPSNLGSLKKIAQEGMNIANSKHTWANICNVFLSALDNV